MVSALSGPIVSPFVVHLSDLQIHIARIYPRTLQRPDYRQGVFVVIKRALVVLHNKSIGKLQDQRQLHLVALSRTDGAPQVPSQLFEVDLGLSHDGSEAPQSRGVEWSVRTA